MLKAKKMDPRAILPTVAYPGEDLGYDLYALEDTVLPYGRVTRVRTGIAAQTVQPKNVFDTPVGTTETVGGFLIRDRSSMASKSITVSGGVIDSGYTGEIAVLMTNTGMHTHRGTQDCGSRLAYEIKAGDKIAQMIPVPVLTGEVIEVEELNGSRGDNGFGSTGR